MATSARGEGDNLRPIRVSFSVNGFKVSFKITADGVRVGLPRIEQVVKEVAPALRDIEDSALQAAPGPGEKGVTVKQLAALAGYGDNGHFREAVRQLIDRGLLVRVRGGVRRAG